MDTSPTRQRQAEQRHRRTLGDLHREEVTLDRGPDVLSAALSRQVATVRHLRDQLARECLLLKGLMRAAEKAAVSHE
jgi:hypothetical protein